MSTPSEHKTQQSPKPVTENTSDKSDKSDKNKYRDSLILPQTDFPMRGNLPEKEPGMIETWYKTQIYQKMVARNQGRPRFVLPDGPPYANGNIHIGHVLNKVLKDIVVKYKNMSGFQTVFIPGWDCHGLPIEHKVSERLTQEKRQVNDQELRQLCRTEALSWVTRQRQQFERLGILADWDNPYLTLSPEYEAEEVRELARILDRGLLYRGEKPVYWCYALQTALAEAEVEYRNHTSPAIYVKFPILENLERWNLQGQSVSIVIWTTTPWTLPANLAIAVHPDFEYGIYKSEGEYLILATALKEAVAADTGAHLQLVWTLKGQDLENLDAHHPFIARAAKIILGTHVTLDAGTGCVHTAPGHGQEDYIVGQKYGLPIYSPVDEAGCFTKDVPEYQGMNVFAANPKIVERLRESGHLMGYKKIEHSYPHCWRSKAPLIFRATPQWFLGMDLPGNSIRQQALKALDEIHFIPSWGEQRLRAMVENRPDWCLSRQRKWGVPIVVFYCEDCGHELIRSDLMNKVADKMEKNGGIEAYYQTPSEEFVGNEVCSQCGGKKFVQGKDILDVWFDSGVCHSAVQKRREGLAYPADIYLEGSDQHRGWFQTSLLSAIAANGVAPFKALVTHGFVNDTEGRKMSKSQGNVVDPAQISDKMGAEILRLWVAYEDYGQDLTCGTENFQRVVETYRRFRNTMRFLAGNLSSFAPQTDRVEVSKMPAFDRWALAKLNELIIKVTEAYEQYSFYKVYHALNHFMTVELSATIADVFKDRLYTWSKNSLERRSAQTVLFEIMDQTVRMMAPILSFLAEETYRYLPHRETESVFLSDFPKPRSEWQDPELIEDFTQLFSLRDEVAKKLEDLRQQKIIGANLDAKVGITAEGPRYELLQRYSGELAELLIVSQVEIVSGPSQVTVGKADGEKCPRCWMYSTEIGGDEQFNDICPKCVRALKC